MLRKLNKNSVTEFIYLIFLLFLFLIVLTPSGFGTYLGAETWKPWSASRIFLTEGKFVQNSIGPLYYLFLTILSPFNYKYSLLIEYFITHLFFLMCLYYLFRSFDKKILGIFFAILLITYISYIQSPKYVLAAGFLILHFLNHKKPYFNFWFPPFLLISFLCNWGYLVFYIGHLIGKIFFHIKNKNFKLDKPTIPTVILCTILICPIIFKADKFYNNHYVDFYDPNYSPVNLDSPLTIGFFQIGNWKKSKKNYQDNELYKADWYITHEDYYGKCKTLICLMKNNPKIIIQEIINDPGYNLRMLTSLIFNKDILIIKKIYFILFLLIFIFIIVFGAKNIFRENKNNYVLFSCLFFGTSGYILALSLTTFSYRYSFPLFPIFILLLLNSSVNTNIFGKRFNNINLILIFAVLVQLIFNIKDFSTNYNNKEFLKFLNVKYNDKEKTNYFKSEKNVFSLIDNSQKILTTDSNWLTGFSKANPKKVYSLFALPPIYVENTLNFLDSFDIILLNNQIENTEPSVGTQTYLRYELYLKDYLEFSKDKWIQKEISNYGKIFIRKINTK